MYKYSLILLIFGIDTIRLWNSNPFPGMIGLQEGSYSNQGRAEVYCNDSGEQYVMMDLVLMKLKLSVDNWDITVSIIIIISIICYII